MDKWFGKNKNKPVARVFHSKLKRYNDESLSKSVCPFCPDGILVMRRNDKYQLMPHDHCFHCAQQVYYVDIVEVRKIVL
jgi:hypothetical protein